MSGPHHFLSCWGPSIAGPHHFLLCYCCALPYDSIGTWASDDNEISFSRPKPRCRDQDPRLSPQDQLRPKRFPQDQIQEFSVKTNKDIIWFIITLKIIKLYVDFVTQIHCGIDALDVFHASHMIALYLRVAKQLILFYMCTLSLLIEGVK